MKRTLKLSRRSGYVRTSSFPFKEVNSVVVEVETPYAEAKLFSEKDKTPRSNDQYIERRYILAEVETIYHYKEV